MLPANPGFVFHRTRNWFYTSDGAASADCPAVKIRNAARRRPTTINLPTTAPIIGAKVRPPSVKRRKRFDGDAYQNRAPTTRTRSGHSDTCRPDDKDELTRPGKATRQREPESTGAGITGKVWSRPAEVASTGQPCGVWVEGRRQNKMGPELRSGDDSSALDPFDPEMDRR
jgi:hypothetical protein